METITKHYKVYKFDELSDDAKEKALESFWEINISHDWWEFVYDDAEQIGIKITSFDTGRGNSITGEPMDDFTTIKNKILATHGESCETYKTVKRYDLRKDDGAEMFKELLEDYLIMLRKEYEYMSSEEAIIETINANDYSFLEDGKPFWG